MDKVAIKGVSWNLLENIFSFGIKFSIGIILARLVSVEDYGIIGIATIFISFTDIITSSGLGQAYIQLPHMDIRHANGLIIVNGIIAIIIASILWITAPFIAIYFKSNILTDVIRWMTIVVVLNSINTIQIAHCRKILKFKTKSIVSVLASVISGTLGIILAYNGFGVWSLVIQQIINRVIITIGLFLFTNFTSTVIIDKENLQKMIKLGRWTFGSNIMQLLFTNFYRFVFGKFLSLVQLSYYDRGQQFPSLLTTQLTWSFNMVALPHFVKKRDDISELKEAHFMFVKYLMFVLLPALTFMFFFSSEIILFLLTKKWLMVAPIMKYLCVICLFIPFYDINEQVYQTKLYNKFVFYVDSIRVILRLINVIICINVWGIYGILIGEILIGLLCYIIFAVNSNRIIGYNFFMQLACLKKIAFATLFALAISYAIKYILFNSLWVICIYFLVFSTTYIFVMKIIDKNFFKEAKELFIN